MKNIELDFGGLTKQFEGLNGRHPGLWPIAPKALLLTGVVAAIVVGGWFAYWSGLNEELESAQSQEQTLKDEYTQKVAKAVNLDDLRRQKVLAEQYVGVLEKQLPSRAEMDALLSDINQAGVGRGAQLQLFRPGSVELKKHYAHRREGGGRVPRSGLVQQRSGQPAAHRDAQQHHHRTSQRWKPGDERHGQNLPLPGQG